MIGFAIAKGKPVVANGCASRDECNGPQPCARSEGHWEPFRGHASLCVHQWQQAREYFGWTEHELRVVYGVFDDTADAETAERLALSPDALRALFLSIYEKMGVHSRMQLVLRVFSLFMGCGTPSQHTP